MYDFAPQLGYNPTRNHENRKTKPGIKKKRPGTLNNHRNPPGIRRNRPGTVKNHENSPGIMKDQHGILRKTLKPTWNHE